MVALYILGGLIVASIIGIIFFRTKLLRVDKKEYRRREEKIEVERIEEADRAEARRSEEKIEEDRSKE